MIRVIAMAVACAGLFFAQTPTGQTLVVSGGLSPITLTAVDLAKMPRDTVSVPDQDGTNVAYEGVQLREVLARAGAPMGKELRGKALASYIVAKARDGYEVVFTLGEIAPEFGNQPILIADKRDGKALFGYQGPFRLVCPNDKAGARSVRMLESLELVRLLK